jgi:hypothetical protein
MRKVFVVCLTVAGAVATLQAQARVDMRADIPFAFHLGDKQMPAGSYEVGALMPGVIIVRSPDGAEGAVRLSLVASPRETPESNMLVFRKYGEDRYFLAHIWYQGAGEGREFPKSKREREAVTSTLVSSTRPTTVTIIARAVR